MRRDGIVILRGYFVLVHQVAFEGRVGFSTSDRTHRDRQLGMEADSSGDDEAIDHPATGRHGSEAIKDIICGSVSLPHRFGKGPCSASLQGGVP